MSKKTKPKTRAPQAGRLLSVRLTPEIDAALERAVKAAHTNRNAFVLSLLAKHLDADLLCCATVIVNQYEHFCDKPAGHRGDHTDMDTGKSWPKSE